MVAAASAPFKGRGAGYALAMDAPGDEIAGTGNFSVHSVP
jgi:hypothetical protein